MRVRLLNTTSNDESDFLSRYNHAGNREYYLRINCHAKVQQMSAGQNK